MKKLIKNIVFLLAIFLFMEIHSLALTPYYPSDEEAAGDVPINLHLTQELHLSVPWGRYTGAVLPQVSWNPSELLVLYNFIIDVPGVMLVFIPTSIGSTTITVTADHGSEGIEHNEWLVNIIE